MSTIPCPGCGMPRAVDLADSTPCPVCGAGTPIAAELEPELEPAPKAQGRPSLGTAPEPVLPRASGFPLGWVAVALLFGFGLGATAGVGGTFAWQRGFLFGSPQPDDTAAAGPPAKPTPEPAAPGTATTPTSNTADPPAPAPTINDTPKTDAPVTPDPMAAPPMNPPPPAGRPFVIEVNEPDGTYTLPFPTRQGEHVILHGKAKVLKLPAVEGGAIIDATKLVAAEVHVERVDGGATVKLNAPEGVVTFAGKVDGKSTVEVNASGGTVRFPSPTLPGQDGAKIDGGSKVSITAKRVELRGDITGPATRVTVTLTRAGALRVATVQGTAVLEYRMENAGWSISDATVGPVGPAATVRDTSPANAGVDD